MKNWRLYLWVMFLACVQFGLSNAAYADANGISAEQLIQLNKLTTEQRSALLNALNAGRPSTVQNDVTPSPALPSCQVMR